MNSPGAAIPGPSLYNFHRNVLGNPAMYFYELMKKHGGLVRCRSVKDIYLVSDPVLARTLINESTDRLDKQDDVNIRLARVIGDGVVVTTGKQWKSQRRRANLILQKHMPHFTKVVSEVSAAFINSWYKKERINLQSEIPRYLMEVLLRCLVGQQPDSIKAVLMDCFNEGYRYVTESSFISMPHWIPGGPDHRLRQKMLRLDAVIKELVIDTTEDDTANSDNILSILKAPQQDGTILSETEIIAESKNILAAGHFSTSDLISRMVYCLCIEPEWQRKIRKNLQHELQSPGSDEPDPLKLFTHEVMRLYPPVWSSWHRVKNETILGGRKLPKNSTAVIDIFNIQRNPEYWTDPGRFEPSRFEKPLTEPGMFIPFGFGQRKCAGMGLAQLIINETLSQLLRRGTVNVDTNQADPGIQSRVTLGFKEQVFINLS